MENAGDLNMTKDEALQFLLEHQPMPSDQLLTQDLIDKYDEVRRFFIENPAKEAIPLFMQSYGDGDGWGVYQLVEDVFYECDINDVVMSISNILENPHTAKGVRYWVTQLAASFPDKRLINGLNISLASDDGDIYEAAVMALDIVK
ncbi:hypothetical protein ACI1AD_004357 [Cronobacter dublinensis]